MLDENNLNDHLKSYSELLLLAKQTRNDLNFYKINLRVAIHELQLMINILDKEIHLNE